MQLPLRQASVVAKQAASLQALTRGRVVLGVGCGQPRGRVRAGRARPSTPAARLLDAGILELRRAWHSGAGTTAGDLEAGGPARYRQLPAPAPVPVWVGGSSEAALRRAATLADGWMPLFLSAAEYRAALERLAKEVDRVGREAGEVTPSIVLFVSIDDDAGVGRRRGTGWMSSLYGIPAKAFDHHLVAGTAAEVADVVTTYRDAGAEHVAVYITADEPLEQFERLTTALSAVGVPTRG
jgi:alkanesulfonate monooxygenase SsuD/methylene tetrahydromethanopterin reductase-like flavin-dependent oxidoreductase (luciferase family)